MIQLDVDYLQYDYIEKQAKRFLTNHSLENKLPIPIEEIIDLKLGVNIVPLPGIQKVFEVEGFTSSDLSTIYVDDYVYSNRPTRYRFTLAHELGHIVLHGDLFKQFSFDSVEQWLKFYQSVDDKDYSKLEFQGYAFGGLILVPRRHLRPLFEKNLKSIDPLIEEARKGGLNKISYLNYAIYKMATILAPYFEVSTDVIQKRIEFDKLDIMIP